MISPEVFYVHVQGEQRGPYTIPQIDHMLNSGLIERETLYWREGMEQWQPVTELVIVRVVPNPWIKPAMAAAVLLMLAILGRMFGPIKLALRVGAAGGAAGGLRASAGSRTRAGGCPAAGERRGAGGKKGAAARCAPRAGGDAPF